MNGRCVFLKLSALAVAAGAWLPIGVARLRAQPSRWARRYPGWFAADPVGPRSRAPVRCRLAPDQALQARGGEPTVPQRRKDG